MSILKGFLTAGMQALESVWGTDTIIVGTTTVRAVWNDSLDTSILQDGGFDAGDIASALVQRSQLPTNPALGSKVTARGKVWRVHEVRGNSDVAVTLTLIDTRSSR